MFSLSSSRVPEPRKRRRGPRKIKDTDTLVTKSRFVIEDDLSVCSTISWSSNSSVASPTSSLYGDSGNNVFDIVVVSGGGSGFCNHVEDYCDGVNFSSSNSNEKRRNNSISNSNNINNKFGFLQDNKSRVDGEGVSNKEVLTMPAITHFILEGSKVQTPRIRHNQSSQGKRSALDTMDYEPNPDVVPFQPANFIRHHSVLPFSGRSSTILKKVPIPKRHQDTFGGYEYNFIGRRGVMLHTDRYQVDFIKSFDGMTQRERLQAGLDYMEAMRGTRRRREMVPHRAQLDLILGGKQIEFEERFDIAREIQKLKAVAMPKIAKELYHGRGIHLPNNHLSIRPQHRLPPDLDDEVRISAPAGLHGVPGRPPGEFVHELPKLGIDTTVFGRGSVLRNSSTLKKHSQLPSIGSRTDGGIHRDVTSLSRSQTQAPPPTRDPGGWVSDQNKLLARGSSEHVAPKKAGDIRVPDSSDKDGVKPDAESEVKAPTENMSQIGEESKVDDSASIHAQSTVLPDIPPPSSESKVRPTTEEGGKSTTPHPLRGTELITSVPQAEQEELRQTFQRLDTDADGHLKYTQVKTQLPKKFTREQEKFTEEVYNLTNSITFFGIDEFMAMNRLSKSVESLTGRAADAYEAIDFPSLPQELLKYVAKFDEADRGNTGKISMEELQRILSHTVNRSLVTDSALWDEILDSISVDFSSKVSKVVFIAHIPLFLSLERDFSQYK